MSSNKLFSVKEKDCKEKKWKLFSYLVTKKVVT